ncbi:hypothetical protein WJX84_006065 [Apatococcus fuscideae]|uniref:PRA1 family protein n=1 Tax=Apatococcus fuscideae TaxID=2026836 RepID=A0AAW1TEY8_9CHLO
MLAERLEENFVHFLGNYVIVTLLLFSIIMARRPWALLGNQDNLTAALPMLTIMGWILFIYTSCLTALLRWATLTALLALFHASFMRPASEISWSRQSGRRTLGWSLAEVYMGRPASGPGSGRLDRRSSRSYEDPGDPRKLLREINEIVFNAAGQAWLLCLRYPQEWLQQAYDLVRYPRIFLNNSTGF